MTVADHPASSKGAHNDRAPDRPAVKISTLANRVAPHSLEAEQALLACCIFEGGQETLTQCVEAKIGPDSFYKPAHQTMITAMLELYQEGTPIDEIILGDKLRAQGTLDDVGGHVYINEVTNRIETAAHMPYYLERVRDLALLRRIIRSATQTVEQAYKAHDDLDQFIDKVEKEFFSISEDRISDSAKPLKDSIEDAVNLVNKMIQNRGALTGTTTGFTDLDKMTSGFHAQEMIVLAARPSMGKTSIALNIAEANILHPDPAQRKPTLVFSLEMSAEQLAMRLLCSYARADMQKLRDGFLDKQAEAELARSAKAMREAPLWIDDNGHMSILEMRAKARRLHSQKRLGLIVIDYLQLISGTDSRVPREQQISEISRGVKSMAKELNVPVIVLSQLNRESEKEKRQPRLSDLRESGSIEQDADVVCMIAKPKDNNEEMDMSSSVVLRDLIIAKQRNGPVGTVRLTFNKRLTRYENFTGSEEEFSHA